MNENNTIRLRINYSTDASAFTEGELIHKIEFDRVRKWIENDIESAKNPPVSTGRIDRNRRHDTITILGTRGSGKTSFILSILTWFDKNNTDVEVLEIIDPTLIEEKGHIFLDVLSVIKNRVENVIDQREIGHSTKIQSVYEEWRDSMEKLAHGLPHVDGIGGTLTDTTWQDPEYIMQRGLRSVTAARDLEKNFTEFIRLALTILDKKAFIIAFDDIDIDFKKGWPVLELLRKYFVSKQIITILSGDMRLYSLAVRKSQWNNFGEVLVREEGRNTARLDHLRELITETESQYLQKVMKPIRRTHLTNLHEKIRVRPEINIEIVDEYGRGSEIKSLYDEILKGYGIYNSYQAEMFKVFLLTSPLRLQIRFFESNLDRKNKEILNILDPFISDLYEMRIDIERITGSSQQLNITLLELLLREKILSETNQLQPTTSKLALNSTLTALSFLFSKTTEHDPALIFDYFVRIGYLRNLLSSIGYQREEGIGEDIGTVPSIEGLCKHSGILQDRVIKDNIGMVTSYMTAVRALQGNKDRPWAGMIPLRGLAGLSRKGLSQRENRIDYVAEHTNPLKKALIYLPLTISQHSLQQGGTVIYSFHVLLATIAEFIRKVQHNDIFRGISELSQLRSYPMPDFRQSDGQSNEGDESIIEIGEEASNTSEYGILEEHLHNWIEVFPQIPIPPHLLGKISTRFFFAADVIQNGQRNEKLGPVMHALTAAFLNAVLIEDVREHIPRPDINLNNTRMSDDILIQNLRKLDHISMEHLRFSKWIFSCPILLSYLNPDSQLINLINEYNNNYYSFKYSHFSVYNELSTISPKYHLKKPRNYDTIISQLQSLESPFTNFELEFSEDESYLRHVLREFQYKYPTEKMTYEKMSKVLEYYFSQDID
ncbi:hypothetical protein [Sphingobacterium sp. SYP-B4668]|uniref:hypothetical protein n=1 Tax=Sphingobacterium sp. SYP-B4668 TaxID=2996035 RepID=UPI0022DD7ED4|nr:hypothetical protein [Sphingobacterium sp. SYP-B4668]